MTLKPPNFRLKKIGAVSDVYERWASLSSHAKDSDVWDRQIVEDLFDISEAASNLYQSRIGHPDRDRLYKISVESGYKARKILRKIS